MSTRMYIVAQLTLHDQERYLRYLQDLEDALADFGATLLVADDKPRVEDKEASWPYDRLLLVEFPTEHALSEWTESAKYLALAPTGRAAATGSVIAVKGSASHLRHAHARYDQIGESYARFRQEDPQLRGRIMAALGDARNVVNVGAGTGSYEPNDRYVLAIEPSEVMAKQRPEHAVPALRAWAGELPLRDRSVDAALAVLSVHHWDAQREHGVRELRRVARGPVVIVTIDPRVSNAMWLLKDYLPEVAALDAAIFPLPEQLASWLGGQVSIETVLVPRETPDWMLLSYWAHPERVLDAEARAATSGFARMPPAVVERVVHSVATDLESGAWERKYGELRALEAYDAGLRIIVAR
jgi:uncharacterized protein (DUF1330 family)/SAM-dependent methyltransferase